MILLPSFSTESGILTNEQANASALVAFLRQEHLRYNELLQTVHASLGALQSAVSGEIVMSETLEATYLALLHNHVPLEWKVGMLIDHFILSFRTDFILPANTMAVVW